MDATITSPTIVSNAMFQKYCLELVKQYTEEHLDKSDKEKHLFQQISMTECTTKSHTMEKKTNFTSTLTRNLKISVLNSNKFRFFPKVIM